MVFLISTRPKEVFSVALRYALNRGSGVFATSRIRATWNSFSSFSHRKSSFRLHRGTVTARSEGQGKGSEFEVTLPLKQ